MAKKPDTPCAACGKLTWSGPGSLPPEERLCQDCRRAGRRPASTATPPGLPPAEPADGFGPRGARLWRDTLVEPGLQLTPAERVVLEEACRIADRLDRLDEFLTGRGDVWLRFHARNEDGSVVRVVVDRALSEARQQADTLRGIVADLVKRQGAKVAEEQEGSGSDDLAERRKANRRAAGL